jgi:hypothetical protein
MTMVDITPGKYVAVKIRGIEHWFWFARDMIKRECYKFIGKGGWGKDGAYTNINVDENLIEGELDSNELQYA